MFLGKCPRCGQDIDQDKETKSSRRYLEGAVMVAYAHWQYGVDPKDKTKHEICRQLFKQDFNYDIETSRNGEPRRVAKSSKNQAKVLLADFTRYAEENGCPIPNAELYKLYKNKWSMDKRFETYHHFLEFLGLEVDAMPSAQTLKVLDVKVEYPQEEYDPEF